MEHIFNVSEKGELKPISKKIFQDEMNFHKGKSIVISIKRYRNQRSNQQNKYYWGVVINLIKQVMFELGNEYTAEDVHCLCVSMFLSETKSIINNHTAEVIGEVAVIKSTTQLNTTEFLEYIDKVRKWASEFFCLEIPDPEKEYEDSKLEKYVKNALMILND